MSECYSRMSLVVKLPLMIGRRDIAFIICLSKPSKSWLFLTRVVLRQIQIATVFKMWND